MSNEMDIEITYDPSDWTKFQEHLTSQLSKQGKSTLGGFFVNVLIWGLIGALVMYLAQRMEFTPTIHWPTAGITTAVFVVLFALFIRYLTRMSKAYAPSDTGCFLGTHRLRLTDAGIESTGKDYKAFHSWSVAQKLERENGMILVYMDTANAFIFPEAKLDDPDGVYEYIREHTTTAQAETGNRK